MGGRERQTEIGKRERKREGGISKDVPLFHSSDASAESDRGDVLPSYLSKIKHTGFNMENKIKMAEIEASRGSFLCLGQ